MTLLRALTLSALAVFSSQSDLRAQQGPTGIVAAGIEHFLRHCGTAVTDPERYLAELPNRNDGRAVSHGNTDDGSTLLVTTGGMNSMQNGYTFEEITHVFVLGGTRSISCVVSGGDAVYGMPGSTQAVTDTFRSIIAREAPQAQIVGGSMPLSAFGPASHIVGNVMESGALFYVLNWHDDPDIPIMVYVWPGWFEMITYKQVSAQ
ncbi:hypothetical protein ACRARG_08470 [Pseudooceanicola sp. C21-150M6]|uniref:hypothetical protein n=1 Tax=Pseudooceanicola sp. C21-150M6 TaxID=3434355 RepID=UPI003D7F6BB7